MEGEGGDNAVALPPGVVRVHPKERRHRLPAYALLDTPRNRQKWAAVGETVERWYEARLATGLGVTPAAAVAARAAALRVEGLGPPRRRHQRPAVDVVAERMDPTLADVLAAARERRGGGAPRPTAFRDAVRRQRDTRRKLVRLQSRGPAANPAALAHQEAVLQARQQAVRDALRQRRSEARASRAQLRIETRQLLASSVSTLDRSKRLAELVAAVTRTPIRWRAHDVGHVRPPRAVLYTSLEEWAAFLQDKYAPPTARQVSQGQLEECSSDVFNPHLEPHLAAFNAPFTEQEYQQALRGLRPAASSLGTPIRALRRMGGGEKAVQAHVREFNGYLEEPVTTRLPVELCTVQMTAVPKPGKDASVKANHRFLGICSSDARVLQRMVNARLRTLLQAAGLLHVGQTGFLEGCSAEQSVWLAHTVSESCAMEGNPMQSLFLDVQSAFASVHHADVADGLLRLGVRGPMAALILRLLRDMQVFMTQHGYRTVAVQTLMALVEGLVFGPLAWNVVLDRSMRRMEAVALTCTLRPAVPLVGGVPLHALAYADDVRLFNAYVPLLQHAFVDFAGSLSSNNLRIAVGPAKTARLLPWQQRASGRRGDEGCVVTVDGEVVPVVKQYKYLGVVAHEGGAVESASQQAKMLVQRLCVVLAGLRGSGIVDAPFAVSWLLYVSRVQPVFTYGIGVWGLYANLHRLSMMNTGAQRLVLGCGWNMPAVVVTAVLHAPSLEALTLKGALHLVLRILGLPLGNMYRAHLAGMCAALQRDPRGYKGSWWARFRARLDALDSIISNPTIRPECPCPYEPLPFKYLVRIEEALLAPPAPDDLDAQVAAGRELREMKKALPYALSWLDWEATQAYAATKVTLAATWELLQDRSIDGRAPYLSGRRSLHHLLRTQLRGGTYQLLGHEHWDVECPWCYRAAVSVPHLLRDCSFWRPARDATHREVLAAAISVGSMSPGQRIASDFPESAHLWYRLLVGASVPQTFALLDVFSGVMMGARQRQQPAPRRRPESLSHYLHLMEVSGPFISTVLQSTQAALGLPVTLVDGRRSGAPVGAVVQPPSPPLGWSPALQARLRRLRTDVRRHRLCAHLELWSLQLVVIVLMLIGVGIKRLRSRWVWCGVFFACVVLVWCCVLPSPPSLSLPPFSPLSLFSPLSPLSPAPNPPSHAMPGAHGQVVA